MMMKMKPREKSRVQAGKTRPSDRISNPETTRFPALGAALGSVRWSTPLTAWLAKITRKFPVLTKPTHLKVGNKHYSEKIKWYTLLIHYIFEFKIGYLKWLLVEALCGALIDLVQSQSWLKFHGESANLLYIFQIFAIHCIAASKIWHISLLAWLIYFCAATLQCVSVNKLLKMFLLLARWVLTQNF